MISEHYFQFIYPIPRNEGCELMVGEFSEDQVYLTSVINYQVRHSAVFWVRMLYKTLAFICQPKILFNIQHCSSCGKLTPVF